jgi:hypothetical protein
MEDLEDLRPSTPLGAARAYWRRFAPAWIFPIVFLFGFRASEGLGTPTSVLYWLVALPLFFWCFFRFARLWLEKRIRYWHCVTLGLVLPFAIRVVAVASQFAVDGLLR